MPRSLISALLLSLATCPLSACKPSDPNYGIEADPTTTDADGDGYTLDVDCDDNNADVNPGATEKCDTIDNNCDGQIDEEGAAGGLEYHPDADGDGYGAAGGVITSCTAPDGYVTNGDDCDDTENDIYPGHVEFCDSIDNNCDGLVDNNPVDATTWYADMDGDGYGDPNNTQASCDQPPGFLLYGTDCDDTANAINPGAEEFCDGVDNNCNGQIDESKRNIYPDTDGDGYGDPSDAIISCDPDTPDGFSENNDDCDDTNPDVNPDASEIADGIDNNCNGVIDEGATSTGTDDDADGYTTGEGDCDDSDPSINPAAAEICDDGIDQNCDGLSNGCGPSGDWSASDADATLLGIAADDHAASTLAIAGDLDGDGVADALIGASENDTGGVDAGQAYVVFGPLSGSRSLSGADATLSASAAGDRFGQSVAGVDDADEDGYRDLLIGAFMADGDATDCGAAYLFLGPSSGSLSADDADAALFGEAASDAAGYVVSGAGDVDGDGATDLVIGAKSNATVSTAAGATYVWSGGASGTLSLADAPTILLGEARGDLSGISVAGGQDQDSDGVPDLLVGATHQDTTASNAGAAYVVSGAVTGDVSLGDADGRLLGELASDEAGTAVAWAGDVNGDGYADALVGAQYADAASTDAGAAYLVYGPIGGDLGLDTADGRFLGATSKDRAGVSVSGAGDVNQDGFSDVVIGALYEDTAAKNAGAAYLLYGPLTGSSSLSAADGRALGVSDDDRLGGAVAGGGDLDGDGADDLLIGASLYDGGATDGGAAFLFRGGGL